MTRHKRVSHARRVSTALLTLMSRDRVARVPLKYRLNTAAASDDAHPRAEPSLARPINQGEWRCCAGGVRANATPATTLPSDKFI